MMAPDAVHDTGEAQAALWLRTSIDCSLIACAQGGTAHTDALAFVINTLSGEIGRLFSELARAGGDPAAVMAESVERISAGAGIPPTPHS